jgi:multiple sugar transport system permease protein
VFNNKQTHHYNVRFSAARFRNLLFIAPSLAGVSLFVLIPFIDVITRSFQNATGQNMVGIKNYRSIFSNSAFLLAGENTLKFIGICIPLLLVVSLIIALLLHEGVPGVRLLKSSFLIPMAIPVASVVFLWKIVFHQQGLLNGMLGVSSYEQARDWMNTGSAFGILVGSYLWKNLGYNVVLWMASLAGISESLYEAAKVDGAHWRQRFTYITLPILKPTLYMITTLAFLNSFKVFREAYLVAGDYPTTAFTCCSIYLITGSANCLWIRCLLRLWL